MESRFRKATLLSAVERLCPCKIGGKDAADQNIHKTMKRVRVEGECMGED